MASFFDVKRLQISVIAALIINCICYRPENNCLEMTIETIMFLRLLFIGKIFAVFADT